MPDMGEAPTLGELTRLLARDREETKRQIDGLREEMRKTENNLTDDIREIKAAQLRAEEGRTTTNRQLIAVIATTLMGLVINLVLAASQFGATP